MVSPHATSKHNPRSLYNDYHHRLEFNVQAKWSSVFASGSPTAIVTMVSYFWSIPEIPSPMLLPIASSSDLVSTSTYLSRPCHQYRRPAAVDLTIRMIVPADVCYDNSYRAFTLISVIEVSSKSNHQRSYHGVSLIGENHARVRSNDAPSMKLSLGQLQGPAKCLTAHYRAVNTDCNVLWKRTGVVGMVLCR